MKTSPEILWDIQSMDPDSWEDAEPNNNDYINFHMTVLAEYGKQAWEDYNSPARQVAKDGE